MEVLEDHGFVSEVIEYDRQTEANEETPDQWVVNGAASKHPGWAKGSPKDTRREEGVGPWTSELILLCWAAHIFDTRHLEVQHSDGDECADERRNHLHPERDLGCDMRVMGKLEILCKSERVRSCHIAVGLEEVHGVGVTGEPETAEELSKDVEGHLGIGNRTNDTHGHTEDECQEDPVQHDCWGRVSRIGANTRSAKTNRDKKHTEECCENNRKTVQKGLHRIMPLRHLLVGTHKSAMNIVLAVLGKGLASDKISEAQDDLSPMIDESVRDSSGVCGNCSRTD